MKKLLSFLIIAFVGASANAQICFEPTVNYAVGNTVRSIASGDFNGDFVLDLVTANESSTTVSILIGTGTGTFAPAVNNTVGGGNPYGVCAADFDGDGDIDIATANSGGNNVTVLTNNGAGVFTAGDTIFIGSNCRYITTGDFNGDTILDIATCNVSSSDIAILTGNGLGGFSAPVFFTAGASVWPQSLITADFNGDGFLDLVTANNAIGSDNVSILLGNGAGSFGAPTNFGAGSSPASVISGYFNGDAFLDLAVANMYSSNVSVLLGTGTGSFGAAVNFAAGGGPYSITTSDYDGDGNLDLAAGNGYGDSLSVLAGDGLGGFAAPVIFAAGSGTYCVISGDYDGDGSIDIATANISSSNASVLLNCNILGVDDLSIEPTISIFPNPSNGIFTINISSQNNNGLVEIYNTLGAKIFATSNLTQQTNKIDLSNYGKGIYFVKVYDGEKTFCKKIIIE